MLHELGHVTGLGHVSEADQLMYPDASEHTGSPPSTGDLAGLKFLGKGRRLHRDAHAGTGGPTELRCPPAGAHDHDDAVGTRSQKQVPRCPST